MPEHMANSSARVLEFEPLRDLLRGYATSDLGRARVSALEPSLDVDWIQNQQRLTTEIRDFRRVGGSFEFAGLIDVSQLLDKSRIAGAVLEALEIRDVINIVDRAAEWRAISYYTPEGKKSKLAGERGLSSRNADLAGLPRRPQNKMLPHAAPRP